jgi:transcription elongation factor Elf1
MKERRHHNPYWELETLGSVALLDVIPLDKMKPTAVMLYLHLLRWQKRAGVNPFPVYTGDLLMDSGMSRETLTQARKELSSPALGLIQAQESGKRGIWSYTLCNPVTGGSLPNREQVIYADVSDWVAMEFYRRVVPGGRFSKGSFDCPRCRRAGTMHVTVDSGDKDRHGKWSCRKCGRYGGFQYCYRLVHNFDRGTATRAVRALLQELTDEEQARQRKEMEPAEPPEEVVEP